ncbi:hypothetical protein CIN_00710 [Commensalibacter intestini A911]|uniref:Glycoside hydrolase family 19 catalytic domain-containing protein n=1 Tax=Commensalibacter intestini A911 TaxID=1088868 RepID=G6EXH5_9PROT|nr:hypothetical protein [Commensalibacter intestini]EHD15017.1 hypothetical protein CIN_00710 [Commensalibacter intestini A911]
MPNLPVQSWQNGGSKNKGSACDATRMGIYPSIITIQMLDVVNPSGRGNINKKAVLYLNKYANCFKMTNHREIAHFLSQIAAESRFHAVAEHADYTLEQARGAWLKRTHQYLYDTDWVNRVCSKTRDKINKITHKKEKVRVCDGRLLLNKVYANVNGNKGGEDGYTYRGRGLIQVTGRKIYQAVTNAYKKRFGNVDFVKDPDLLSDDNHYDYATASAFLYWRDVQHVQSVASAENSAVSDVTKQVNNGCNGYRERVKAFKRIAEYLNLEIPNERQIFCWTHTKE